MESVVSALRTLRHALRDERQLSPFLRGISMGALVGAAIAGSTIWRRAKGGSKGRT